MPMNAAYAESSIPLLHSMTMVFGLCSVAAASQENLRYCFEELVHCYQPANNLPCATTTYDGENGSPKDCNSTLEFILFEVPRTCRTTKSAGLLSTVRVLGSAVDAVSRRQSWISAPEMFATVIWGSSKCPKWVRSVACLKSPTREIRRSLAEVGMVLGWFAAITTAWGIPTVSNHANECF